MKISVIRFLIFLSITFIIFSCTQLDVYEKNTIIPGAKWNNGFVPKATFTISDTTSAYNIIVVLRHTDYYKYNNIWLEVTLQQPIDSVVSQKIDLTFASDAAGGWEGTGINDIWEIRKPIIQNWRFKHKGDYTFGLKQIMRDNPLLGMLNAGIRVERAAPKN